MYYGGGFENLSGLEEAVTGMGVLGRAKPRLPKPPKPPKAAKPGRQKRVEQINLPSPADAGPGTMPFVCPNGTTVTVSRDDASNPLDYCSTTVRDPNAADAQAQAAISGPGLDQALAAVQAARDRRVAAQQAQAAKTAELISANTARVKAQQAAHPWTEAYRQQQLQQNREHADVASAIPTNQYGAVYGGRLPQESAAIMDAALAKKSTGLTFSPAKPADQGTNWWMTQTGNARFVGPGGAGGPGGAPGAQGGNFIHPNDDLGIMGMGPGGAGANGKCAAGTTFCPPNLCCPKGSVCDPHGVCCPAGTEWCPPQNGCVAKGLCAAPPAPVPPPAPPAPPAPPGGPFPPFPPPGAPPGAFSSNPFGAKVSMNADVFTFDNPDRTHDLPDMQISKAQPSNPLMGFEDNKIVWLVAASVVTWWLLKGRR